ncbi:MAG TPA: thioredoxin domain-containing protein [Baekduia sp.]|nr:thioredoxin domain-containing protein [Baekduia sp.]
MADQPSKRAERDAARDARVAAEQADASRAARLRRMQILGAVAGLVVAAIAVIAIATGGADSKKPPGDVAGVAATNTFLRGLQVNGDTLGDPKAPVTLVEYVDLQCPICKAYSQQVMPTIVDEYVRTGKVRLQTKVVSILGDDSTKAQRFASGVQQQNELPFFTHLFFENQGEENTGYVTDAFLRKIATAVPGLDVDKVFADQSGPAAAKVVQAADAVGINSTPTFKIGTSGGALRDINIDDGPQAIVDALNAATK